MSGDSPELATKVQALPTGNGIDVATEAAEELKRLGHHQLAEDIEARIRMGEKKYGTRLKSHNGRDALLDLLQEALDAINYAKQLEVEGLDDGTFFRQSVALAVAVRERMAKR
jgi:predicted ArsR family transcriptional regulator